MAAAAVMVVAAVAALMVEDAVAALVPADLAVLMPVEFGCAHAGGLRGIYGGGCAGARLSGGACGGSGR